MSLKLVHVFFITVSMLMCVGIAVLRLMAWQGDGGTAALVQGATAGVGAAVLVAYAWHFIKKYGALEYR